MRGALTLLVIVVAALIIWAVVVGSANRGRTQPDATPPEVTYDEAIDETPEQPAEPQAQADDAAPQVEPEPEPESEPSPQVNDVDVEPIPGLHPEPADEARVTIIGSNDAEDGYKLETDLSAYGASVLRISLTDYHHTVAGDEPYVIAEAQRDPTNPNALLFPFAARTIWVNGEAIDLAAVKWRLHQPSHYRTTLKRTAEDADRPITGMAEYRLNLLDEAGDVAIELRRRYILAPDSYHLRCRQRIINHTGKPVRVTWEQRAQSDIVEEEISYMGDRRMLAAGYYDTDYDPDRLRVYADRAWTMRSDVLKDDAGAWPNGKLQPSDQLVWLASLNRYFTLVAHPRVPENAKHAPLLRDVFPNVGIQVRGGSLEPEDRIMALILRSDEMTVGSEPAELELDVYAGPREKSVFSQSPNDLLGLSQLIKYEMSAFCSFCTFQWLAKGLLDFLEIIHIVVRDWGVSIIVLVMVVRLILHPITKKAQVNMQVMGKQMQSLQPELEKLKKKYGDDPKRMQTEQMKLYREKGVNPAGMVGGCLPMFLQMPIWIALYAMLFFAIELRHESAFYGVFQLFGDWGFLADLSSPDAFIRFSKDPVHVGLPLLNMIDFSTLNILPLVWSVTMYFQQKLTSPPPATEQAAQQQKMMRIMVFLFPIMLYSAPSGLTLYILASTSAGILDSYIVRKHVREQEEAGTLFEKKKRKSGGVMDRISKTIEEKHRELMAQQEQPPGGGNKPGGNKSRRKRK